MSDWLPALDGVVEKLKAGGRVADVGCGHGVSTILMAQTFPNSQFVGIDYHDASIETAREHAAEAGVANASFEVADATTYPGDDYDVIAFFDCLHDMANPSGAARHARQALKPDGICMLVEPAAGDSLVGQSESRRPSCIYGASSLICVPVSLAQHGPALGAQAGEQRSRKVMVDGGGFTRFRRATETPFNLDVRGSGRRNRSRWLPRARRTIATAAPISSGLSS